MLSTVSKISAATATTAYETFRATCALGGHGGNPPDWTSVPGSHPDTWTAPDDAAGTLVLWYSRPRVTPPRSDAPALLAARLTRSGHPGTPIAAYMSSGHRVVVLCQTDPVRHWVACELVDTPTQWWIAVIRDEEEEPRAGATERALLDADPGAQVYLFGRWPPAPTSLVSTSITSG